MKGLIVNRKWIIGFSCVCTLIAAIALSVAAKSPQAETGPTAESALAADNGKPYKDVGLRQTEVWVWKDGAWKCVLTNETGLKDMPGVISSDGGKHWTKIQ